MSSKGDNLENKIVLSYHDCLLRNRDVDLLCGPHWLNDAIIGFYFEFLEEKIKDSTNGKPEVLFVSPEMTQLLKLTDIADFPAFLGSLNATERSYIFFPLNNCESRDSAGGSHWSLLVYSKKEKTCFHLDSCRGTNRKAAASFAKKIMNYLSKGDENIMEEASCPQQENGYDCGLFALCLVDIILRHVDKIPEIRKCKFDGVKSLARTKRQELLDLIEELRSMEKTQK